MICQYDCMISFFRVFLKANLWRDFISSLCTFKFNTEFTIICRYYRKSIGRPGGKSCIILVPFIDRCEIIGEGWCKGLKFSKIISFLFLFP